jgi:hypothetical protein
MNLFTSAHKFLSKSLSMSAIIALVGMYAQPAFVAQAFTVSSVSCPIPVTTTFVSDTSNTINSGSQNAVAATVQGGWTASIPGATWIWSEDPITSLTSDPLNDVTQTFQKAFTVNGTITSATLNIAADNNFNADINGNIIGAGVDAYASAQSLIVDPSWFISGTNTLNVDVTNTVLPLASDPTDNPAGLLYSLNVTYCPDAPTIALNGSDPTSFTQGDTFTDLGATASDSTTGNLDGYIVVTGGNGSTTSSVDTSVVGSTTLVYTVTDPATGLSASTTREVDINAAIVTPPGGGSGPATSTSPVTPISCTLGDTESDVVSDVTNESNGTNPAVAVSTPYNVAWTASIPGATWIWSENPVTDETVNATSTFTKDFSVDASSSIDNAQLDIAADNSFSATLNGHALGNDPTEVNFSSATQHEYTVDPSFFVNGTNTVAFTVTNFALNPLPSPDANPAGLLYKLSTCVNASSTATTTTPVASTTAPTITLIGTNPTSVTVGTTFTDPGADATTTVSGDVLGAIVITGGPVDTTVVGSTTLTYTVTDTTNGLSASTSREVDIVPVVVPPTTPITPDIIFSGGGGGGGGGGGFGFGGTGSTTIAGALSCPFMTQYILSNHIASLPGHVNDPAEIRKLQTFLIAYENDTNVTVNGVLDAATIAGIDAFQQKYLTQVMGPWNSNAPSGDVYITTLREINEIVCGPQPAFTAAQIAVINAYLAAIAGGNNGGTTPVGFPSAPSTSGVNSNPNFSSSTGAQIPPIGGASTTGSTTPNNSALTGNVISSGLGGFFGNIFSTILGWFGVK